MNKELLLFQGPLTSRSGYGDHARDIVRSLIEMDRFDIKIVDMPWGSCPRNALSEKDGDIISRFLTSNLDRQPDVFMQISVPNEFQPVGKYNIGITAGMETTMVHHDWIIGCNRMDRVIVPSNHSKKVFMQTQYEQRDENSQQITAMLKIEKPIDILFEGLDTDVFKKVLPKDISSEINKELAGIKESFCYLFVGHWLNGIPGQDRKDLSGLIKVFYETFKDKSKKPALIIKTSQATFSVIDREQILKKVREIKSYYDNPESLPNVYLLHGNLTQEEMNDLYNHPKVKAHVSFTKGEGFGRPLLEASVSAKPVIASNWSGHVDFLSLNSLMLPGGLTQVHESAVMKDMILKEAQWFTVDYGYAKKLLFDVYKNYKKYLDGARKQAYFSRTNFSMKEMNAKFSKIIEECIPKRVEIKLPQIDKKLPKLKLPKLKKLELEK